VKRPALEHIIRAAAENDAHTQRHGGAEEEGKRRSEEMDADASSAIPSSKLLPSGQIQRACGTPIL
jgi:hypothetical protein